MLKRLQLHEQCQLHDLSQVIDHLARHCFAPDDSLVSKSTYYDLQLVRTLSLYICLSYRITCHAFDLCRILQAREEMCRERLRYLESMVTLFQFMQIVMIELVFRHSARVLNVSVHVGLFEL